MKLTSHCHVLAFVLALTPPPAPAQDKADLVLLGGKVVTVDPQRPVAEASPSAATGSWPSARTRMCPR